MKRFLLFLIVVAVLIASLSGCGGVTEKNQDKDVDLADYGLTEKDMKAKYDFKSTAINVYFKIVSEMRIYQPNADIEYLLYLDETVDLPITVDVKFVNTAFKVNEVITHSFAGEGKARARVGKFKGEKNGIYEMRMEIKNENGNITYSAKKNVGVMPKAERVADGDFYFGVQTYYQHLLDWETTGFKNKSIEESYKLTWDYVDYIGANLIRDGSSWGAQQVSAGSEMNFLNNDRIAKDSRDRGVTFNYFLGGTPNWAVDDEFANDDKKWNKPPKAEHWQAYVDTIAERYKDDDNIIFEVINECNWFDFLQASPERYLDMLDVAIDSILEKNPDARIMPGGMVTPNGSYTEDIETTTYYKRYKELIDENKIQMIPYHNHWEFQQFVQEIKIYRNKLNANNIDKKYSFLNESGLESSGPEQGYEVLKKALWAYGNNHSGFVMFAFRATPDAGSSSLPSWGSITELNEPKELYISYGNYINMMNGAKIEKVYANDVYNAYLFEKNDKHFLVHFRGNSAPDAKINLGSNKYTVIDYLGNEAALESGKTIGPKPVYVQFDGKIDPLDISLDVGIIWEDKLDFGWKI